MNDRAIELYRQAMDFAYTEIDKEHAQTAFFQGVVAGKFAELIVRECASLAYDGPGGILEHFGVKE